MTVAVVDVASSAQLSNFLSSAHAWAGSVENCPEIPIQRMNVKLHLYKYNIQMHVN